LQARSPFSLVAPAVTGFPVLTLMGQFTLKDTVPASAAITLVARDAARHEIGQAHQSVISTGTRPGARGSGNLLGGAHTSHRAVDTILAIAWPWLRRKPKKQASL
jgi:hypothetical protein